MSVLQTSQTLILGVNSFTRSFTRSYADGITEASSTGVLTTEGSEIKSRTTSIKRKKYPIGLDKCPKSKRRSKFVDLPPDDGKRYDSYGNEITKGKEKQQRVTFGDEVGKHFKETVIVQSFKKYNSNERPKDRVGCCGSKCLVF
jgi:hypothetical protein